MTKQLPASYDIRKLIGSEVPLLRNLLSCFAAAFEDPKPICQYNPATAICATS